ncbi:flavodoxin [Rhodococcus sp. NPDC127530]|uniref:flavodoxin n=1 Tax=unclassified Rhodococcus (in: high G+C Gram-positive bacteria) TaxID=192944 RepID=UPI0036319799
MKPHLTAATSRRSLVCGALALGITGLAGLATGCSTGTQDESAVDAPASPARGGRVLLAYFSRPGQNYYYGDRTVLDVGNTEILAGLIADRTECDVHRIEPAQAYPFDYEETVEQNRREQQGNARPAIAGPLNSIAEYDVVILASPVWNSSAPMIMRTFTEALDFGGKTVYPVTTHAVSGLSGVPSVYEQSCPGAIIGVGLAVQGEIVGDAAGSVDEWLRGVGLQ